MNKAWTIRIASLVAAGCLLAIAAAEPRTAGAARETLRFRNGDYLFGSLESIDGGETIRWRHGDSATAIDFRKEALAEIELVPAHISQTNSPAYTQVRLINQDQLDGDLKSVDAENIVLDTWYAGTLKIPRKSVQMAIVIGASQPSIFEGPKSLEGWTMGKINNALVGANESGDWKFKDGAFYASRSASIARNVNLPDAASIQFDLAWRGFFHLAIALYTDYMQPVNLATKETEPDFGGFYSLQFNTFYANLLPIKKLDPLRYLGQAPLQMLNSKSSAHVDIRMSKSKRSVALLVDGTLVKDWIDPEPFAGTGKGVRFVHQGQGAVRLSNIRVTEWDGQFEEKYSIPPGAAIDIVKLRTGERLSGTIQTIQNAELTMSTPAGSRTLKLPEIKQLEFAPVPSPAPEPGAYRAFFVNGSHVTFKVDKWDATSGAVVESPNFGKATFKPSAFNRLQVAGSVAQ